MIGEPRVVGDGGNMGWNKDMRVVIVTIGWNLLWIAKYGMEVEWTKCWYW